MLLFDHFSHIHSVVDVNSSYRGLTGVCDTRVTGGIGNVNKISCLKLVKRQVDKTLPKKHEIDQFNQLANMRLKATFGMK